MCLQRPFAKQEAKVIRFTAAFALWVAALLQPLSATAEVELIMVEEAGCIYCARWSAEVGPEYPLTPEGRAAPLRRMDISAMDSGLELVSTPRFTPTFILIDNGRELARLEGYPGEDFFWGLLMQMLNNHDISLNEN